MKMKISESVNLGEGVSAEMKESVLTLSKAGKYVSRAFMLPKVKTELKGNELIFSCDSASKRELKIINSSISHLKNMISGLDKEFTYVLEACNVHFPMTLKIEKNILLINNFLGEKVPRRALINPVVKTEINSILY